MSLMDPECHPQFYSSDRRVCAACFGDCDLQEIVRGAEEYSNCDFCGARRAKTIDFDEIASHIRERAEAHYGKAVDQLPYETAEGGYQGNNFDTYDLLVDEIGLELPRDRDQRLFYALMDALGDDQWCAYDWTQLEIDESLAFSWRRFAETIKHERRFFFHQAHGSDEDDDRSPIVLLNDLKILLERRGLIRSEPAGYTLYRARPRENGERHTSAASLGPPPAEFALQSNRMNPPGIPMFYGAEKAKLALAEVRDHRVSLGRFETLRPIRLIDLVDLPHIPGFFSDASRNRRQHLAFLHDFAREIAKPVPRDDRVNVDYLPTQVFTEFLRDASFSHSPVDGIRYPSATGESGANVVLFATQEDIEGATEPEGPWARPQTPWLRLTKAVQKRGSGGIKRQISRTR